VHNGLALRPSKILQQLIQDPNGIITGHHLHNMLNRVLTKQPKLPVGCSCGLLRLHQHLKRVVTLLGDKFLEWFHLVYGVVHVKLLWPCLYLLGLLLVWIYWHYIYHFLF
jgi:hypothetical protein